MATELSVDEIEPFCKWHIEEQQDVLEVHLQGFKKEQLRVQINSLGVLTISGERPQQDQSKRVRFCKEIRVSNDCKRDEIHAKFSRGMLYITMPKRIQNQENRNANQNSNIVDNNNKAAADAGTSGTLSMMSKQSTKGISGLQQMGGKTALKLGALAAVIVVVAAGAYVAYKYRRDFHVDNDD